MCGGKDLIKEDGVFVCQSCGCKYSPEEAKKIMIEDTVEVKGKVSVDSSDSLNNFIIRGNQFFEKREYEKAEAYYDKALDIDANSHAVMNNFLEKAKQLFNDKQYSRADVYFNKVLYIEPNNSDALKGISLIDKIIVSPNLTINRANIRNQGEAKTIVFINGVKHKELDLDRNITVKLPLGNHRIYFKRAALNSRLVYLTINSRKDKFSLTFEPKFLSIKTTLIKTN